MHDPRTDSPREPLMLAIEVSPTLIPALERITADMQRRNPKASGDQIISQMFFEAVILLDARTPKQQSRGTHEHHHA